MKNIYIVGAGFFGAVMAERITSVMGYPVTIFEKRGHIGGNSWSSICADTGIECHNYGSHIFHTSNETVWNYVNRFCRFNDYRHRVLSCHKNKVYSLPINLSTINSFYDVNLKPNEVEAFLAREIAKEKVDQPANLEEQAINLIGRPLYDAFIKGYTKKQWNLDPQELPSEIITRLPIRYNFDDRYFSDKYEGVPVDGYKNLFQKMLDSPLIDVRLNTDFSEVEDMTKDNSLIIYTGAIDRFFHYQLGCLEWRTVNFEKEVYPYPDFQGAPVMNYADEDVPWTRIHEFRYYHPERCYSDCSTVIYKEYSGWCGKNADPYYPVNTSRNRQLQKKYLEYAENFPNLVFGGRLGTYQYLDMDDTIAAALDCFEKQLKPTEQIWRKL